MGRYSVILFRSSSHSLWAARHLKKAGIGRNMIPIPRSVSADCGYCVRILSEDVHRAKEVLANAGIEFISIELLGEQAPAQALIENGQ
jgi:hypothetical protein